MTEQDLNSEWARSQIEAWVDGSLDGASRERMRTALRNDARLRAAVERATAVRAALRANRAADRPAGLRWRLLSIPSGPSLGWTWLTLPAAAAAVAIVAGVVLLRAPPTPAPPDPRIVAIEEFELAMQYLHKSARITQDEVTDAVGAGVREALLASSESMRERNSKEPGG